jgi:hypothetical protein
MQLDSWQLPDDSVPLPDDEATDPRAEHGSTEQQQDNIAQGR